MNARLFYASQTGTSQLFAAYISAWMRSHKFLVYPVSPLRQCELDDLLAVNCGSKTLWIFLISSATDGEIPFRDGHTFWKKIMRKDVPLYPQKPPDLLCELGLVLIDEQHPAGSDGQIIEFVSTKLSEFCEKNLHSNQGQISKFPSRKPPPKYLTTFTVLENKRITPESHFQDVRLISLKSDGQTYNLGSLLYIAALNPQDCIDDLSEFLRYYDNQEFRSLFLSKFDLNGVPSPCFIAVLSTFQH
ncbi:hypothetical protein ACOME3_006661 [Neoechinorhynchus agilis]